MCMHQPRYERLDFMIGAWSPHKQYSEYCHIQVLQPHTHILHLLALAC